MKLTRISRITVISGESRCLRQSFSISSEHNRVEARCQLQHARSTTTTSTSVRLHILRLCEGRIPRCLALARARAGKVPLLPEPAAHSVLLAREPARLGPHGVERLLQRLDVCSRVLVGEEGLDGGRVSLGREAARRRWVSSTRTAQGRGRGRTPRRLCLLLFRAASSPGTAARAWARPAGGSPRRACATRDLPRAPVQ